ncbi:hypothetical protein MBLNU13_g08008t1 [Cladosporium sp. NU13]
MLKDPSSIIFAFLRSLQRYSLAPRSGPSGRNEQWDNTIGTGRRRPTWTLWLQLRLIAANARSAWPRSHELTRRNDIPNDALNEKVVLWSTGSVAGGQVLVRNVHVSRYIASPGEKAPDFLTERTVGMEPDAAPLGPACLPLKSFDFNEDLLDFLDPSILLLFEHDTRVTPVPSEEFPSQHPSDLTLSEPWDITMSARLEALETELIKHVGCSPGRSMAFNIHAYRSFFSPRNAREFITRFCRKRHYRYQIIHWPTFEPEGVSLALLMVVCLTGAAYSFDEGHGAAHAVQARSFYQVADSYVFQQLEYHLHGSSTDLELVTSIEICQAALLMYALDALPAGDMAMQHTAVARRLPTLIIALRTLGFVGVKHGSNQDWETFIHHEQRIRLDSPF